MDESVVLQVFWNSEGIRHYLALVVDLNSIKRDISLYHTLVLVSSCFELRCVTFEAANVALAIVNHLRIEIPGKCPALCRKIASNARSRHN
jgi:hypothetical protein